MKAVQVSIVIAFVVSATAALAQPGPDPQPPPDGTPPPDGDPPTTTVPRDGTAPTTPTTPTTPTATPTDGEPPPPVDPGPGPVSPYGDPMPPTRPPKTGKKLPDVPQILVAPTGRILPAAIIYTRTTIDTGGGLAGELRVGLGDVAEFGIATTDLIRSRGAAGGDPERIAPYVLASFRLGVTENRWFRHQPAIALGFRKSFETEDAGTKSRIAELHLMVTKKLHDAVAVHVGGTFWDASLKTPVEGGGFVEELFHDQGVEKQLRATGGIEVRPLPDAEILVDVGWAPTFCYDCTLNPKIRLEPILSWGVRYLVADWIHIEAGVRVPDIGEANLLNAQIFGQLVLQSGRLKRAIDALDPR
jgi:hypothetical protein